MYFLLLLFIVGSYIVYRWATKNQLAWEMERELHEESCAPFMKDRIRDHAAE